MKKCPFCAEEIQDAAIKCRYCGSMLTEATPTPVQVFVPPPNVALDEEIKRLLGEGKKVDAIELVLDRRPVELVYGLTGAKAYVEAVENGSDPALALRQLAASLAPRTQGRSRVERVFIGVGIFFILLIGVPLIVIIILNPASRASAERQPVATASAPTNPAAPVPTPAFPKDTRPTLAEREATEAERARAAEAAAAEETRRLTDKWSYATSVDPMTSRNSRSASIASENTVSLDFPYGGAQHGTLTIRNHPSYGRNVLLSVERGQFLCQSYTDCQIRVRFDEGKPERWNAVGPADNSTTVIFLRNEARFVQRLRAARIIRVQAAMYQQGAPAFEFQVRGFDYGRYAGHP